jgi:hypothetical protein
MKSKITCLIFFILIFVLSAYGYENISDRELSVVSNQDTALEFIDYLSELAQSSNNPFFAKHCNAIIKVLRAKSSITSYELQFVKKMYSTFTDATVNWNASDLNSYLERKRPFIISWTSPTDGVVSLAWLVPPIDWDPAQTYPLYVSLHGLYSPYQNPIEYMSRYLDPDNTLEKSFEDGYSIYPWGRGNLWYEGISETDVWESISAVDSLVKINPTRKYLVGHSMGGYGVWVIGQNSPDYWAALGIYAGALWYNGGRYLTGTYAEKLKEVPVYIVCGTQDGLLGNNQTAFSLLQGAGNTNIFFTTFPGGHESLLENWENMYFWIRNYSNDRSTSLDNFKNKLNFNLQNNFPNPFNPSTVISYQLSVNSKVNLRIFNSLGQEIEVLVNDYQNAGFHSSLFTIESSMPSGVYFYQLRANNFIQTNKMLLLK